MDASHVVRSRSRNAPRDVCSGEMNVRQGADKTPSVFCELVPVVASSLHATSTATTGPARILTISPQLPHPLLSTSVDRNGEACSPPPPFVPLHRKMSARVYGLSNVFVSFFRWMESISCSMLMGNMLLDLVSLFSGGHSNPPAPLLLIIHQHDFCQYRYWQS